MMDGKHYLMSVLIADSTGFEVEFAIKAEFYYDSNDYGNGTHLALEHSNHKVSTKRFSDEYLDIRYSRSYDPDNKVEFLAHWATNNWDGIASKFHVKRLVIEEA